MSTWEDEDKTWGTMSTTSVSVSLVCGVRCVERMTAKINAHAILTGSDSMTFANILKIFYRAIPNMADRLRGILESIGMSSLSVTHQLLRRTALESLFGAQLSQFGH